MKKLSIFLTLFILVACKPSELERCIEANIENLNDGEKVLLELEKKIKKAESDLNFFEDFSSSLQLTYGLSPLIWEDGLPFNKEKAIENDKEFDKEVEKITGEVCPIFDFKSMESYQECQKNIISIVGKEEIEKRNLNKMKTRLSGSDKEFQEYMVMDHYYNNHILALEYSDLDLEIGRAHV